MGNAKMRDGAASDDGNDIAVRVQEVVRQVHGELRQLYRQRAEVMRRIGTIKRTMVGLAALFGEEVLSKELRDLVDGGSVERKPGFTKACRSVLMKAGHAMSSREVHDQLNQQAPALLSGHKDPMASVTTVLNRLADYGEAQRVFLNNGRRAWQWIAEPESQSSGLTSDPDSPLEPGEPTGGSGPATQAASLPADKTKFVV